MVSSAQNAEGWDRLADAYQRHLGWPDHEVTWGFRLPPESELGVLDDAVTGAATVVVGCGGGQDLVALHRMGAGALIGVDPSAGQLEHARRRCQRAGIEVTLHRASAEDLSVLHDASADLVVSVQALNYASDPVKVGGEVVRILRPGGVFAFSVMHPADAVTADAPPYGFERSWFDVEHDWDWDGLAPEDVSFRSWFPSPSDWFAAMTAAGLHVERMLEPPAVEDRSWIDNGWLDEDSYAKLDLVPGTLILRARRPGGSGAAAAAGSA